MDLNKYFKDNDGIGILSTADSDGRVDSAIYARPHLQPDHSIALIMRLRRSYRNLQSNPHAAYMFIEKGPGYKGIRLDLNKISEEDDPQKVDQIRRSCHGDMQSAQEAKLVYFTVEHIRPLVGDKEQT